MGRVCGYAKFNRDPREKIKTLFTDKNYRGETAMPFSMPSPETSVQIDSFSLTVSTVILAFSAKVVSNTSPVPGSRRVSAIPTLKVWPTAKPLRPRVSPSSVQPR